MSVPAPLTWRLWKTLHHPGYFHPLLRRRLTVIPSLALSFSHPGWRLLRELSSSALVFVLCVFGWLLVIPFALLLLGAAVMAGTLIGARIAYKLSDEIARQRENGVYDLIAMTEQGRLGANWAIACRCILRDRFVDQVRAIMQVTVLFTLVFLGVAVIIAGINTLAQIPADARRTLNWLPLIEIGVFLLALRADYLQSITLGTLIGMYAPTLDEMDALTARLAAPAVLLAVQGVYYVVALIIDLMLIGVGVRGDFSAAAWILMLAVRLTVFVSLREVLIWRVWRALNYRLNTDTHDQGIILLRNIS